MPHVGYVFFKRGSPKFERYPFHFRCISIPRLLDPFCWCLRHAILSLFHPKALWRAQVFGLQNTSKLNHTWENTYIIYRHTYISQWWYHPQLSTLLVGCWMFCVFFFFRQKKTRRFRLGLELPVDGFMAFWCHLIEGPRVSSLSLSTGGPTKSPCYKLGKIAPIRYK